MPSSPPLAPMPPAHLLLGHLPARTHAPLDLFLGSQRALGDVVRYRWAMCTSSSSTFAMMEAQFVLAMITQRFRLSPSSDVDVTRTSR